MIKFTEKEFKNPEIDGVDPNDFPDFSDAFFVGGTVRGMDLSEAELEWATENFRELLNDLAHESLF
jgi:hypothetical protein